MFVKSSVKAESLKDPKRLSASGTAEMRRLGNAQYGVPASASSGLGTPYGYGFRATATSRCACGPYAEPSRPP
jgi:hypothetical protein